MRTNKIALITGGSSGIGKEIAIQLAKSNIDVCINFSKSEEKAKEVKHIIEKFGGKALTYKADITIAQEVKDMFNFISTKFGGLDILVNNAGVYIPEYIEDHNLNNWEKIIDVNLKGKLLCTKYATPLLKESSTPRIINIATRAAVVPMEESSAYCCAAAGTVMLTKVSALELSKYNIKVNTISPGLTRTPMTKETDTEEDFNDYAKKNPSKRVGTPMDIANAMSLILSFS